MIELRKVDESNYLDCIKLSLKESQTSFISANVFSLAQAYIYPEDRPLAIYSDGAVVGFAMYLLDKGAPWIYRFMIDQAHQGKGLGKKAFSALLEWIKREYPDHSEIFISFKPENIIAENLYVSLGFEKTGEMSGGECIARLNLPKT